ncbi:TonB-dependent receptor [Granulicella sp. WH15]|uniref:TonB-dependent receptor n=1 Tax=Granulicella sp. WH15 TaxID=2602070 RepID=UPI0013A56D53|nr:TonB-dependent receptor [Granulicella sp. WH15]
MSHVRKNLGSSVTVLLLSLLFPLHSPAQSAPASSASIASTQATKGLIIGTVVDNAGASVPGAKLQLAPLGVTVVSNDQGQFRLPEVPAGKYRLTVSYVGFAPLTSEVELAPGQSLNLNLALKVNSSSEQIMVTAERPHGEAEAINQTRTADNIVQVLPAEVITSLPNANVADAIGRLPSVSLYRIEGEGVYIQIRGTEPRLTNVTVDGITIPAPEPTVRQVRLDVIPSDMVEAIELNKTLSANQDANGIGGSVNLRTKEAGEQPTLNLYGNGGYTPILNGRGSYATGGTAGKRFGVKKQLGLLGNVVYDYNGRGIDNIQPSLDPLSTMAQPFYDNNTIREYRYYRYRYGFDGSADYKFNENNSVYAHGFYSDLKDWGDKWYYQPISTALTATGVLPSPTGTSPAPKFYTSSKRPNASVGTIILGGRDAHTDSLFTWQISASRSYEVDSAGNPKADFSWIGPSVNCNFSPSAQTDLYHPRFGNCDNSPTSPMLNPNNFIFKDITISKGNNTQLNLTAQTSYAKNYSTHGYFGTFEAGFKFSNAHQSQNSTETVYDGWSTKAGSGTPTIAQLQSNFNNTDYFNGAYFGGHYGPVSDFNLVQDYTLANFSGYVDGQKTAADIYPNLFHTVEQITAGYLMNTIDIKKLHLQAGLRFENTRMMTFGYNLTFYGTYNPKTGTYSGGSASAPCAATPVPPAPGNCYVATGINNNPSYLDVLPSIQARYSLTPNSALRAVYARGVARPDPYQLVPYVNEDSTSSPVSVGIGNPALRPEHANNYDVLYENYLNPLGLIQAGFFFKQLNAPQIQTTLPGGLDLSNFPPGYFPAALQTVLAQYPGDAITQFVNGQNAWLYGLELSYQQHLSFLPGVLRGLGIAANYSYTASREKGVPLRTDHPTLIDQSPNMWNLSPTYDTKRLSVRLGMTYNGASLFSYNYVAPSLVPGADPSGLGAKGPSGDVYTLTHYQVDAQASYRFYKGWSAVVSGLNLNNEVFGYYTGSTQFVNQREYYKPTYTGGIRYNFQRNR